MLNRSIAPTSHQDFFFDLPKAEIYSFSEQPNLVFLPGIKQDIFKLEIVFNAGKWFEHKPGIAHFTALILDKGTKKRSSKNIAELLDYFGAQLEISAGYDFVSVAIYGLKKYFKETFEIFNDIIIEPSFPNEELEIQKEIFLQSLKINNEKNNILASKLLRKNIFGNSHPYGNSIEEPDVLSISSNELNVFFKSNFTPQELFLIGDFDSSITQWISSHLNINTISPKTQVETPIESGHLVERIDKVESLQSSIRLGQRTINRNHEDYFSLLLLNHILGGYFGSRLMKNIREKKGLTYGIYSSINPFKHDSMFSIGADVGKEKVELALAEIKKEISLLTEEAITPHELELARNHFLGSLQLEIANPFAALEKIKNLRLNKLEPTHYTNLVSTIREDNAKHLQSIANKHLLNKSLFEVVVG